MFNNEFMQAKNKGCIIKLVPIKRELRTRRLVRVEDTGQRGHNLFEIIDGELNRAGPVKYKEIRVLTK